MYSVCPGQLAPIVAGMSRASIENGAGCVNNKKNDTR